MNSDVEIKDYSMPSMPKLKEDYSFKSLKITFKEVFKFVTSAGTKDLFKFIVDLVLLLVIIILISLPFTLIIDLGGNFIGLLNNEHIFNTWEIILNLLYTIIALYYYCVTFNKRFRHINEKYKTKLEK